MVEARRLREAVWSSSWGVLRDPIEATAEALGVRVFLVGGHVRDLLLERRPSDFDLTVEGAGLEFAARLAEEVSGELHTSERFLTSGIDLPGGLRVDIATARSESYDHPGALPTVAPADLQTDLERRDFTVNTFALGLAGAAETELSSVEGALADLTDRKLRILHSRSFFDDPTRILRAVRQEQQLRFRLSTGSEAAAREAATSGALMAVSGERLWAELAPLLTSLVHDAQGLRRLESLHALAGIMPRLGWSAEQERSLDTALDELERLADTTPADGGEEVTTVVALLALASTPDGYAGAALAERFSLNRKLTELLRGWPDRRRRVLEAVEAADARPSTVHAATRALSLGELIFQAGLLDGSARVWMRRAMTELRRPALELRAVDLLDRGHTQGPVIGCALERTLAARLDGEIGPEAELEYALGVLESLSSSSRPES